jgi:hypothetical protein
MKIKLGDILSEGQFVYHTNEEGTWIGQYIEKEKGILYNGIVYLSLSSFAQAHSGRTGYGWRECMLEINGEMVQASVMKHFIHYHNSVY